MVRIISFAFAAALAMVAAAYSQQPSSPQKGENAAAAGEAASEPAGGDGAADAEGDEEGPTSELDRLSRTTDSPFPTDENAAKRRPVSVTLRALDKITARYTDIETPIGVPVRFGSLEILPHYCDKRPPEEFPETTAFLEIFDRGRDKERAANALKEGAPVTPGEEQVIEETLADGAALADDEPAPPADEATTPDETSATTGEAPAAGEEAPVTAGTRALGAIDDALNEKKPVDPDRIFSGWMFASSPALNALEHPVYDVWVIDCKTEPVDN